MLKTEGKALIGNNAAFRGDPLEPLQRGARGPDDLVKGRDNPLKAT